MDPQTLAALKAYRRNEMVECFQVIDTCLADYYAGKQHMYRPIAGQLRILLCRDRKNRSLLSRVYPKLKLTPLRSIEPVDVDQAELFPGVMARQLIAFPRDQEFGVVRMPFIIDLYENGLQVADLDCDPTRPLLPLEKWLDQLVTVHPSGISLRQAIKSIAERGGGAHVDDSADQALSDLRKTAPERLGLHILLPIAVGRLMQHLGLRYVQMIDRLGEEGKLGDVVFDPNHPSVRASARIPESATQTRTKKEFIYVGVRRIR